MDGAFWLDNGFDFIFHSVWCGANKNLHDANFSESKKSKLKWNDDKMDGQTVNFVNGLDKEKLMQVLIKIL